MVCISVIDTPAWTSVLFISVRRLAAGSSRPPFQMVPGALFSGVKRPEREADQSPSSSVEIPKLRIHGTYLKARKRLNYGKVLRAVSRVKRLNGERTNASKSISVLVLRVLIWIHMDRNGLQNPPPFNHLTRLIAQENFIILSRQKSSRSYTS